MKYKLGEICSFQSGGTPSKTNAAYFSGDIPWITTVALNGQVIGKQAAVDWITKKAIAESAAKIVPARSIMIGTRVGVGKVAINESPMSTSQDIISLVGIDESLWSKEFLCRFIQAKESYLKSQARGATIKGIKIDVLASLDLPDVSIDSQQEIVAVLDKIQNILAARRSQLSALDDLIKARFVEMFGDLRSNPRGWPVYCFEDITEIITDGEHATPRRVDQGIYLLSARNVLDHALQLDDVDFIDQNEYDRIAKRIVPQAGDVLISCSGSVGRCCTVPEGLKFQMVRSAALLRFDKRVLPVYAEYMITSDDLQDQINSSKTASSQANLFQGKIAKLKGFVPPIAQQEQFVAFVSQIDKSKSVIQKSLDETQLLFDSLMQKYFG